MDWFFFVLLASETTRKNNIVSSDRAVHPHSIGLFFCYSNSRRISKEPADRNHKDRLNPKASLLFVFSYNLSGPFDGFPLDVCVYLTKGRHRTLDTFFTTFSIQTCFKASLSSHWTHRCLLQSESMYLKHASFQASSLTFSFQSRIVPYGDALWQSEKRSGQMKTTHARMKPCLPFFQSPRRIVDGERAAILPGRPGLLWLAHSKPYCVSTGTPTCTQRERSPADPSFLKIQRG